MYVCVCVCVLCCVLSHVICVQLFATPWTIVHQALHPWDFPGKNTAVGCQALLQGIFPTQGWDLPNSGMESVSLASPTLAGGFFTAFVLCWGKRSHISSV